MNNADVDVLRHALETRLEAITKGSDRRGDIVIQQAPDALDQTQFAAERDLTVSLLNRDSQMFRRVRGALERLGDGTYGVCLSCEDPISPKRLRAVPWAELCLGCQERSDMKAAGILGSDHDEAAELGIG
jgi:DnaK suppressor protein